MNNKDEICNSNIIHDEIVEKVKSLVMKWYTTI